MNENALCKKTLQSLKELGSEAGPSFFSELLGVFQQTAVEHLAVLRSAIAGGETERLSREAHALKGASLTIGATGMAEICKQLENLAHAQSLEGAPEALACLDREFARAQSEIEQESLIA
jgi:two-component system, sensor histidine kinase and response regulator